MSSSKKPLAGSISGALKKCQGSEARNIIGVSQSGSQTVEEYKVEFFDKAESLGLLDDEILLAKWFRDGLREDIKAQVRETTIDETMDQILEQAYSVETRLATIIPEVSVDKYCMVSCDDNDNNDEDPEEDIDEDSLHGDYHTDSRYWVYDDLDQWGVGTPPH